ncbi:MAG: V-type ATPase subunit [Clostridia bacterium]|nr:V-type ATPase subunit [Clostridia bacterium]
MSEKYYYAVARTAEKENSLLDAQKLEQLIAAPSAQAALKLLAGTVYAEQAEQLSGPAAFEKMLEAQSRQTFDYLREVCPQPQLAQMYLVAYDVANLKVLLRQRFLGADLSHLLSELGTLPLSELKEAVAVEDYDRLEPELRAVLMQAAELYEKNAEISVIDFELDAAQFAAQLRLAKEGRSEFLAQWVRVRIDLANLRDFLRTREGGKQAFYPCFIAGGTLDVDFFTDTLVTGEATLPERLVLTPYAELAKTVEDALESGSLTALEKQCDDYVTEYIRGGGGVAFGPEKLAAYVTAKQTEIAALRMILVGKINSIPADVIRARLRTLL